jgi:hypothetical protein
MLNRIAICCLGLFSVCLLVLVYFWFQNRLVRAEAAKAANASLAEEIAQKDALESLDEIDLNPADLSLERLEAKLHQPQLKQPGSTNTTKLRWACGVKRCAIWASFPVPFGQEIPPAMSPAALGVNFFPAFSSAHLQTIGGIHVGETVEEMRESCEKRGYGLPMGSNRISWDGDWSLIWGDGNGKIDFLAFAIETMIKNAEPHRDVNSTAPLGVSKGDAQ